MGVSSGTTSLTVTSIDVATFDIDSVEVTASAAELNALAGAGISDAEAVKIGLMPSGNYPVFSFTKTMTDADWTAGVTLIPATASKQIVMVRPPTVVSTTALTCTATTNVYLKDTTGSPVTVLTLAVANLSGSSAVLTPGSTGYTLAAVGYTGLASGKGLVTTPVADVTSATSSTTITGSYILV